MLCPVCKSVDLLMSDRQGIEIDYCPTCRGVWLDRGELDKLIERSVQLLGGPTATPAQAQRPPVHADHHGFKDADFGRKDHGHGHGHNAQRRPLWRELFD